jgi:hypothetical protein
MQFLPCQVMTIMCINVLDCNRQFLLLSLNTNISRPICDMSVILIIRWVVGGS